MPHVVVIGGGLAGLTCAFKLCSDESTGGADGDTRVTVVEGRDRLGGRVLTIDGEMDCGGTWVWPDSNPRVCALARAVGAQLFGDPPGVHVGSQARFVGGTGDLISRLATRITDSGRAEIVLGDAAVRVENGDKVVTVVTRSGRSLQCDVCVVAVPPRVALENLTFEPSLPDRCVHAMRSAKTWMAQQGKWFLRFRDPASIQTLLGSPLASGAVSPKIGRDNPNAGPVDAYFWHTAAGSAAGSGGPLLFGFLSHDPKWRSLPAEELDAAARRQAAEKFGRWLIPDHRNAEGKEGAGHGAKKDASLADDAFSGVVSETRTHDWRLDREFTCSGLDLEEEEPWRHPAPMVLSSLDIDLLRTRNGILLAASETDPKAGGFLEGAVNAGINAAVACFE